MIEPLRLSFEVACDRQHAFDVWTTRASMWWPPAHTVSHERAVEIVFEPRPGGRIFERTQTGREYDWGQITAWEPPDRLAYLWHIASEPVTATDVEIRFVEAGTNSTRVEVQHSGWGRLGLDKGENWRDVNRGGWNGVLPAYITACVNTVASTNN